MTSEHQVHQLRLLHRATLAFGASLHLDEIFHTVLEEVRHALHASGWAVWVLDEKGLALTCRQAAGPGSEQLLGYHLPANVPLLVPVVRNHESLYVRDARSHPSFDGRIALQRGSQVRSLICAPLSIIEPTGTNITVGVIVVIAEKPDAFTPDDLALVDAFAASASVAIRNGRLYQQARQEIDERRRVESALRESEGHYRTLVETSPDAVVLIDLNGRIQMCNRRALELYGYDRAAELLGRTYLTLFPPQSRARAIHGFESVLQGTALRNAEITLLRRDGTYFEGEIAAALAADNAGEPASIVGFARDITDRKEAEAAMRRHNEELSILNDMAMGISKARNLERLLRTAVDKTLGALDIDTGWIVLFASDRQAENGAEVPVAVYRGVLAEPTIRARSRLLREEVEACARQSAQPVVRHAVELFDLRAGVAASCPVVGIPLTASNVVVGVMGMVGLSSHRARSIPARQIQLLSAIGAQVSIAVENVRLAAEAAEVEILRELERMRSGLIADFSHDLRTPLGLIEMSASTLLRDDLALDDELQDDLLRDIMTQTRRLSHLVEGILDLGRLESGQLQLNRIAVDVGVLIDHVSQEMQKRYTDHRFALDTSGEPLLANADPHRIEQVLYNLLDNAAKYSPQGGDIRTLGQRSGDSILVRIIDTGIGIPQDQLPLVFERFYRVNDVAAEGIGGVGLGLSACKGIIEAHGGEIWVESTHGSGSTFAFTLPTAPDLA